jgi:glycosyltransferase involved in cell wall biosynthesis
LRILILHNRYQQPGGEDIGVRDEYALMKEHGHDVELFEENNDHIEGLISKVQTALTAAYSWSARRKVSLLLTEFQPDVVHVHNFFPVLTPSVYFACNAMKIPVVQTLHNYRLLCPKHTLFREGRICESCLGRAIAWPGLLHACYRDSYIGTAAVASISFLHRILGTFERRVALMILLSEFSRKKFISAGFPPQKLVVKPCFVDRDPGIGRGDGGYVLFVGRLSEEKGIWTLLNAWEGLGDRVPLYIAGGGPLENEVKEKAKRTPGIRYLGYQDRDSLNTLMRSAEALIFPSTWFEGLPRTIVEAFACGTPVIASRLGTMSDVIEDGRTGLHFEAGNVADLVQKVKWMCCHNQEWSKFRDFARGEYEAKYTPERNYAALLKIYLRALDFDSLRPGTLDCPNRTASTEVPAGLKTL